METNYYFIAWIIGAVACAVAGSYREIGWAAGLMAGVMLSPIFGMAVVLSSANKKQLELMEDLIDALTEEVPEEDTLDNE